MFRQLAQRSVSSAIRRHVAVTSSGATQLNNRAAMAVFANQSQRTTIRRNATASDGAKGDKKEHDEVTASTASAADSSQKQDAATSNRTDLRKFDEDEYDDWEPKTAKEKVGYYSQLAFILGLLGLAAGCVYVFIKEVNPFGRSPQAIFDKAVDRLVIKDEILAITGTGPRAYGRDYGAQSEGRRNIVDSRSYKEERDGSNRTRVRFNIKGSKGRVMVWAEVSDKMSSNEYVYLIAQDMRTGRIITVEDNRSRLETEMGMSGIGGAAGGGEAKNALMKLLGGGNDPK